MNANLIQNEWPEDYGVDINPSMALASLWQAPMFKALVQILMVGAVLLLAATQAHALGTGQTSLLGMGWWEGLFDAYTAGAYDAGGATIVAL